MKRLFILIISSLIILPLALVHRFGQDKPPQAEPPQQAVAVKKGRDFILSYLEEGGSMKSGIVAVCKSAEELVLYTLICTGADPENTAFKKLLTQVLSNSNRLEHTYRVALLAMALEALDGERYQTKIAQCGQFLVDYQCANGQWGYEGIMPAEQKPTPSKDKPDDPSELKPIKIKKSRGRKPEPSGDNSNTQYAILGLRACMEAQVIIPKKTFQAAEKRLLQAQAKDGGWDYDFAKTKDKKSYGSMTAGGVGALIICKHYQKRKYKKSTPVRKALKWLAKNFTVTENPGLKGDVYHRNTHYHYYYLYALERAGQLYGTEKFGQHEWYTAGVQYLISQQDENGRWCPYGESSKFAPLVETSFALLFLSRATQPLTQPEK